MPLTPILNKRAARPDLSKVMARSAEGFDNTVRCSLKKIESSDSSIGLLGFEITQYGITYVARYKDDLNNDKCSFEMIVPKGQLYMRHTRGAGAMRISEKAHALMLMMEAMGADLRRDLMRPLNELEKACFVTDAGTIKTAGTFFSKIPDSAKPTVHYEMKFPDDSNFDTAPKTEVRAVEWAKGQRYQLLDFSGITITFITDDLRKPSVLKGRMSKAEAEMARQHIENYARAEDIKLLTAMNFQGLWPRLQATIDNMPNIKSLIIT